MSIKLALLKTGEDVIAEIKELVSEDSRLVAYVFENPYVVNIIRGQLSESDDELETKISFSSWIPLSGDDKMTVFPDSIVTIVEPLEGVKKSYEGRMNGRGIKKDNSSSDLNESVESNN